MEPNVDLVKRSFAADVRKRAIPNTSTEDQCVCGTYQYYSQKCGCLYKSVFLKCGRTVSEKTGEAILCPAGRRRKVKVETAMVPFRCAECRRGNTQLGIRLSLAR
ncbi:hypothetical protein F4776DRAFT_640947 [Hypoxylon sp. NC0597]|nr:hypothetical protein F4776DRAFT_640938 [Hypoxylon sp. NC0597]KAI0112344.1 hypothetical protein F4776DRAFT_640947 [Hypoxylon sp. NC0597]